MDPDAALREIRELLDATAGTDDPDCEQLSVLIGGLDDWLTRGGYLPQPWARPESNHAPGEK